VKFGKKKVINGGGRVMHFPTVLWEAQGKIFVAPGRGKRKEKKENHIPATPSSDKQPTIPDSSATIGPSFIIKRQNSYSNDLILIQNIFIMLN